MLKEISCAGRSEFLLRAKPERSEGGWSEAQRSGAKWQGRGLGQRNTGFEKKLQYKPKKEKQQF